MCFPQFYSIYILMGVVPCSQVMKPLYPFSFDISFSNSVRKPNRLNEMLCFFQVVWHFTEWLPYMDTSLSLPMLWHNMFGEDKIIRFTARDEIALCLFYKLKLQIRKGYGHCQNCDTLMTWFYPLLWAWHSVTSFKWFYIS